jgi:AraC-like DNA-binding protein
VLGQDHLSLRLVRLTSPEEWVHPREGLAFVFPKGGTGKCGSGNSAQDLGPGDVLLLNEGSGRKVSVANGAELVFWCFSLCLEHLFPLFADKEIAMLHGVADDLKGPRLYPASSPLATECHRLVAGAPPKFNLAHRGHLLQVAATILSDEFNKAHGQRIGFVRVEEHMIQVFEKLPADDLLSLSVGDLADRFGCSRRHLNRLFHLYFGLSVAALRMEMRLMKALSLLRDPEAKVINVAEQCGFNHLGLFNTCFKRRFGTTPGHWRKSASQAGKQPAAVPPIGSGCPLVQNGLCPLAGALPTAMPFPPTSAMPQDAASPSTLPVQSGGGSQIRLEAAMGASPKTAQPRP